MLLLLLLLRVMYQRVRSGSVLLPLLLTCQRVRSDTVRARNGRQLRAARRRSATGVSVWCANDGVHVRCEHGGERVV